MKKLASFFAVILFLLYAGCAPKRGPQIITQEEILSNFWTPQELILNIAGKKSHESAHASYHFIRLRGAENPHIHTSHDLTVILLSGKAKVHFRDREFEMEPGDVVEIPHGIFHWAENLAGEGSEVYAIFTPPYDGKDYQEEFPEDWDNSKAKK